MAFRKTKKGCIVKEISIFISFILVITILSFIAFYTNLDSIKNYFYHAIDTTLQNHNLDFISAKLKGEGIKSTTVVELKGEVFDPQKKQIAENVIKKIDVAIFVDNKIKIVQKPIIERLARNIISDVLEYPKEDVKSDVVVQKQDTSVSKNETLNPIQCSQKLSILLMENRITFEGDSIILTQESFKILDKVIQIIKKCKNMNFDINGYTDNRGNRMEKLLLSGKRAEVVKNYIVKEGGFNPKRFRPIGYGPYNPIADNSTLEGRKQNTRIEFVVIGEGEKK